MCYLPSSQTIKLLIQSAVNMEQFNLTKELVLDLLGWGVSPEYLVDCGLTREAVFYSFTELNLRLPKNLDVSGLVPLPRPSNNAFSPPLASATSTSSLPVSTPSETPNLPSRRPSPSRSQSVQSPNPKEVAPPASGPAPETPSAADLNDMEARRRQELKARKAVLASRKKKVLQQTTGALVAQTIPLAPITSGDIGQSSAVSKTLTSIAPTDAVDNFLKSMLESSSLPSGSPENSKTANGLTASPSLGHEASAVMPQAKEGNSDGIPGLGSYLVRSTDFPAPGLLSPETTPITSSVASITGSNSDAQRSKSELSAASILPSAELKNIASTNTEPTRDLPTSSNGKRGTKRPVAMDFVEDDRITPGGSRRSSPPLTSRPAVRRKIGGFAGLGSVAPRRCVINLSDSEDEFNEVRPRSRSNSPDVVAARTDVQRTGPSRPSSRNLALRAPSTQPLTKPSAPPTPTPEVLIEKEEQIKRMRELIAQSELRRLKKLAEVIGLLNSPCLY